MLICDCCCRTNDQCAEDPLPPSQLRTAVQERIVAYQLCVQMVTLDGTPVQGRDPVINIARHLCSRCVLHMRAQLNTLNRDIPWAHTLPQPINRAAEPADIAREVDLTAQEAPA